MAKQLLNTELGTMMSAPVIAVNDTDDFHLVEEKMSTYDIRHLPVIDHMGRIVGIISQRQLYKIHSPHRLENGGWHYDIQDLDNFILKRVMIRDPYTLKPGNTLREAIDAMVRFKFGCVPIVDDIKRPLGIVTRDGILDYILKYDE